MKGILAVAAALAILASGLGGATAKTSSDEPARYVVGFHDAPGVGPGDDLHGARVLRVDAALRFATVEARDPRGFEERAAHAQGVRYVEPDPAMQLIAYTPNDTRFPTQYGPQLIGAPAAWNTTTGAASVTVCIVDTGVRYTHEDLAPAWAGGWDFVNNDADPWDDQGHGTHVTGTAAAAIGNGKGIAGVAGVAIKHAKALNATGSGTWSQVASGIRWCADQGAASIGLSLGSSTGSTTLQDAVNYAWTKGAVIAAASGNNGATNGVLYPARYANAIAVGCVYSSKAVCSFSNQGPELDLVAPGSGIDAPYYTGDTAYARLSGTSMATPHVAGAAALVKAARPNATNADIRAALEGNAEDLGAAGFDTTYGRGLARVDRAIAALAPAPAPSPSPAPSLPDLVPSSLLYAPSAPVAGENVTLTARVTNVGGANANASTLRFLLDGAFLADRAMPALAPGATALVTWTGVLSAGAHRVDAIADAGAAVAESNETNNTKSVTLSVAQAPAPAPAPAAGVDVSPDQQAARVRLGGTASYAFTVTNTGNVTDTVTLSVQGVASGWRATLDLTSARLAPGESVVVTMTVKAPRRAETDTVSLRAVSASDPTALDIGLATTTASR